MWLFSLVHALNFGLKRNLVGARGIKFFKFEVTLLGSDWLNMLPLISNRQ